MRSLGPTKQLTKKILRATVGPLIKHLWIGPVSGLKHIPRDRPAVVISNHSSYIDFLIIGTVLELLAKRPVYFWANNNITKRHPLFRHLASVCEAIPMDRHVFSGEAWRKSLRFLKHGRLLAIFPEGTRSRNGQFLPFNTGYLKLAVKAGVPVIPIRLDGAYKILPPHRRYPRLDRKCAVSIHPPFHITGVVNSKTAIEELNRMIVEKYYSRRSP